MVEEVHSLTFSLFSLSYIHTNMQAHQIKSKLNWLKEDDAIKKNNHEIMSSKRRINSIISINVNNDQVEGVANVRGTM